MRKTLADNEKQRLDTLRRYAIVNTPVEEAFDTIAKLAARLLNVPIILITFIDEDKQWFKAAVGTDVTMVNRKDTFCTYTIQNDNIMQVEDASLDERFQNNPFVKGAPYLRSYLGIPLRSNDGFNIGTMCSMDLKPRKFSNDEQKILKDFAFLTTHELELRLVNRELNQLSTAISHLDSGVVVTDPNLPDDPIVFANPGFLAMAGYTAEEIIGRNCRFLQGAETSKETISHIREALAAQKTFRGEFLNYRKDGTEFWNDLTISPVFDQNNELINFVGLQENITERKRTADELHENFEKLKELEKLRDNLTGMIVHDLRSPLTAIISALEVLKLKAWDKIDADDQEMIVVVTQSASSLKEMITSLLDVSRMEAKEMPVHFQDVDLRNIIIDTAEAFLPLMETRSFERHISDESLIVSCDADLIKRILINRKRQIISPTTSN